MNKPLVLPRWATDGTNNAAPSTAQMDSGWTPNQDGVSSYDNWFKNHTHQWLEMIDEIIQQNGTVLDLTIDGSVEASDLHYTDQQTVTLDAATYRVGSGATYSEGIAGPSVWTFAASPYVVIPLPVRVGDKIHGWISQMTTNGVVGATTTFRLLSLDFATGYPIEVIDTQTVVSGGTGAVVYPGSTTDLNHTVVADRPYRIVVTGDSQVSGTTLKASQFNVSRPRP